MLKSEIKPGVEYAFREHREPGTPFQRVRIIQHARGTKWRAEWIEPSPGLIEYVDSVQLVVPWREHKAFLKEEANEAALQRHNRQLGYVENSPVTKAVSEVFGSVGDDVLFYRGVLCCSLDAVDRVKTRAKMDASKKSPVAYVDRTGRLRLPFDEALEIAQKFCAAEPAPVLLEADKTEREWSQEARRPGEDYIIPLLNEYRAAWALIRQWAGYDAAIEQREAISEFAPFFLKLLDEIKTNMESIKKYRSVENPTLMEGFQKYILQASVEPSSIRRRNEFLSEAFRFYKDPGTAGRIIGVTL